MTLKHQGSVFFFRWKIPVFEISSSILPPKTLLVGFWSLVIASLQHPSAKNLVCSRPHVIARGSISTGPSCCSVDDRNLNPAKLEEQSGILQGHEHWKYLMRCCNHTVQRQVKSFTSNISTPILKASVIASLMIWKWNPSLGSMLMVDKETRKFDMM